MELRCISDRLNYVEFRDGNPVKVSVGDTFTVRCDVIPDKWVGLVEEVKPTRRVRVTNPSKPASEAVESSDSE